jgi:hypothetical protein
VTVLAMTTCADSALPTVYQTYYRDPANYACSATFNITNGVVLDW